MRTPTSIVLPLALALASCGVEGASAPPSPELTPAPPRFDCVPVEEAILGVWQRDGAIEELRANGTFVLNGQEGSFRWRSPGHLIVDVHGVHEERIVGLSDVNELLVADENLRGWLSTRFSTAPPIPSRCYDLTTSIVGTWASGDERLTFERDGAYHRGDETGTWTMPANGHVRVESSDGARDYVFAQLSDTTAMSFVREQGSPVTLYRRAL